MLEIGSKIIVMRWIVGFSGESSQSIIIYIDAKGVNTADQHIDSQIKLIPFD